MTAAAREQPDLNLEETILQPHEPMDSSAMGNARGQSGTIDRTSPGARPGVEPDSRDGDADGMQFFKGNAPPMAGPHEARYLLTSGARPLEGYTIKHAIGRGGFGEVYYARSDSGKDVALKLILRNLDVERRGVSQCMNLKCPNLVTIFDLRNNEVGDSFVIMELVSGPNLTQILKRYPNGMPMAEMRTWLRGLVNGVAYLHDHGIVHRDLKPGNLFFEDETVKIGDYGLSKMISHGQGSLHSDSIGTCHYMAPEISTGRYSKAIDIYAMGVILHEMITGRVPFDGQTVGEVLMKHLTSRPDLSGLPEPYKTIIGKALAKDPNQRPKSVYELLPPEDRPNLPEMRFIGDTNGSKPSAAASRSSGSSVERPAVPQDDILRIGEEEPVMYIGPDTKPPRMPRARGGGWRARRAQTLASRVAPRAPQPPPPPPPLPSGRVRVAELSGSMIWAAVWCGLLAVPVSALLQIDVTRQPQQFAFVAGLAVLATWIILGFTKYLEGRSLDYFTTKAIALLLGVGVGSIGLAFSEFTYLKLPALVDLPRPLSSAAVGDHPNWLSFAGFFGLSFAALNWPKLANRDRSRRFRLWPICWVAAVGLCVSLLAPFPQPWGLAVAAMTVAATQLSSPWSVEASTYARYVSKQKPPLKAA